MERNGRAMLGIGAMALAVVASGSMAIGAEGAEASNFVASNDLYDLTLPDGWQATEHADGGGASLTGADGALTMTVTFIPNAVLQSGGLKAGAPAGAGPMAIAEGLTWLLAPLDGVEPTEPVLIDVDPERDAVEIVASGADIEGALLFLEPEPGVTAIATVSSPAGGYGSNRDMVVDVLSSIDIVGGADALMAVLEPPPLVDASLG